MHIEGRCRIPPEADKDRQSQRVLNFKIINQHNPLKQNIFDPLLKFETLSLGKSEIGNIS